MKIISDLLDPVLYSLVGTLCSVFTALAQVSALLHVSLLSVRSSLFTKNIPLLTPCQVWGSDKKRNEHHSSTRLHVFFYSFKAFTLYKQPCINPQLLLTLGTYVLHKWSCLLLQLHTHGKTTPIHYALYSCIQCKINSRFSQ